MFTYPDNPLQISLEETSPGGFCLRRLDADPPGTWYASTKWDGHRRFFTKENGKYTWRSKPGSGATSKPLPADLQAEFEALPWPDGITLDMEFVGPRMIEHKPEPSLHVFDVLLHNIPFKDRLFSLKHIDSGYCFHLSPRVHLVEYQQNPGLVDFFALQTTNPLSEGIVVRRFDQRIKGHPSKCVDGNHIYKVRYRQILENVLK